VGVVLGEAADSQQAVKHAAALVAVDGAEFGEAYGKIAVAAQLGFIDEDVARAVHGLQLVIGLFDLDGTKHVFAIEIGVAGGFPQVESHDVRRVDQVVAALEELVAQPRFDQVSDEAALGVPENQARAGFFLNAEKIELRAELAMIAAFGFLEAVQVFVELFLREERRGVDALELRVAFLAFPVSPGDIH
jgi:hypothetical protein